MPRSQKDTSNKHLKHPSRQRLGEMLARCVLTVVGASAGVFLLGVLLRYW